MYNLTFLLELMHGVDLVLFIGTG